MAQDYLNEIRAVQPQAPYSLMGNCIGGALAYEIARRLKAEREDCNLVLLDSFCPTRKNFYGYLLHEYGRRIDRFFRDQRRSLSARLREAFLERKMPRSGKSRLPQASGASNGGRKGMCKPRGLIDRNPTKGGSI